MGPQCFAVTNVICSSLEHVGGLVCTCTDAQCDTTMGFILALHTNVLHFFAHYQSEWVWIWCGYKPWYISLLKSIFSSPFAYGVRIAGFPPQVWITPGAVGGLGVEPLDIYSVIIYNTKYALVVSVKKYCALLSNRRCPIDMIYS